MRTPVNSQYSVFKCIIARIFDFVNLPDKVFFSAEIVEMSKKVEKSDRIC